MTEDPDEAARLAEHLISLNEERKSMTEAGVAEGIRLVEERKIRSWPFTLKDSTSLWQGSWPDASRKGFIVPPS